MGDSLYLMGGQTKVPVEPSGALAREGWMPGTYVEVISTPPSPNSGAMAKVDRSDGLGVIAGMLITGPQHRQQVELESDMWTTDSRQRPGGETRSDWTAIDASAAPTRIDKDGMVGRMGTAIVTMSCGNSGLFKAYVYEKFNLAERTVPGSGAALVYRPGDVLFVSGRGWTTKERESPLHVCSEFAVLRVGEDSEGEFIIFAPTLPVIL